MTARAPALLLLSRARVEWQDAAGVTSVEVVKDRVDEALAQLRPKGAKGQVAYVLVGPSLAQVQRLPGIPEILAEDEAAAVVHAHVGEFLIGVAG
nr:hypothetical protein [Gemmatimonadaceae bacterium]